jgi:hypothetical protein
MTNYILKDGRFQRACGQLQASGWTLNWEFLDDADSYKKSPSKIKITCSVCGMNLWGAPGCFSICDPCLKQESPEIFEAVKHLLMAPETQVNRTTQRAVA